MSVKLTKEGKQCKLCLKKGGPCHIHAGKTVKAKTKIAKKTAKTVKSRVPKKTIVVKAPKRRAAIAKKTTKIKSGRSKMSVAEIDRIATLPRDILQLLLLEMGRAELTTMRKMSKRAREISNSSVFKEEYLLKHPIRFFTGSTVKVHGLPAARQSDDQTKRERYFIRDSKGNSVLVAGMRGAADPRVYYITWIGYAPKPTPSTTYPEAKKSVPFSKLQLGYKYIDHQKYDALSQLELTIMEETKEILDDQLKFDDIQFW